MMRSEKEMPVIFKCLNNTNRSETDLCLNVLRVSNFSMCKGVMFRFHGALPGKMSGNAVSPGQGSLYKSCYVATREFAIAHQEFEELQVAHYGRAITSSHLVPLL